MKKFILFLIIIFYSFPASAQYELSASMGIDFLNSPSLTDYLNLNYPPPGDRLGEFNAAIIFSLEGGYFIHESYQIALETGYLINSYTMTNTGGKYEMSYNILMPSILNYYVIGGDGYNFKFGGGLGIRFLNADESLPGSGTTKTYTSAGYGFLFRAEGNTLLSGSIYAKIGLQARYDLNGKPENNGIPLKDVTQDKVNFNSFSIGASLGISYIF
jgi:hypothetical protein